jgi:hypothetical protein
MSVSKPLIVEPREWSHRRDLKIERVRRANRLRDQLGATIPRLGLGVMDEDWMLDLREAAPPAHLKELFERVLKKSRLRCCNAAQALSALRKPRVAGGTLKTATAPIRVAIGRLRLVNRQPMRNCGYAEPIAGDDGGNARTAAKAS